MSETLTTLSSGILSFVPILIEIESMTERESIRYFEEIKRNLSVILLIYPSKDESSPTLKDIRVTRGQKSPQNATKKKTSFSSVLFTDKVLLTSLIPLKATYLK